MKIRSILILLFCKLYDFAKLTSKDNLYHITSWCVLAGLLTVNIYTSLAYLTRIFNIQNDDSQSLFIPKMSIIIIYALLLVILYFSFIWRGRYVTIYNTFKRNSNYKGSNGSWIVVGYVIITVISPITLLFKW